MRRNEAPREAGPPASRPYLIYAELDGVPPDDIAHLILQVSSAASGGALLQVLKEKGPGVVRRQFPYDTVCLFFRIVGQRYRTWFQRINSGVWRSPIPVAVAHTVCSGPRRYTMVQYGPPAPTIDFWMPTACGTSIASPVVIR